MVDKSEVRQRRIVKVLAQTDKSLVLSALHGVFSQKKKKIPERKKKSIWGGINNFFWFSLLKTSNNKCEKDGEIALWKYHIQKTDFETQEGLWRERDREEGKVDDLYETPGFIWVFGGITKVDFIIIIILQ